VDYDMGRVGQAYHDSDYANYRVSTNKNVEWNKGHLYRNDGVDIKTCNDGGSNGYAVGWIREGEWLQYTLEVPASGTYQLQLRTAADSTSGAVDVLLNGSPVQRNLPLVKGAKGKWQYTTAKPIALKKGINKLRIYAVTGGFDFNQIKLTKAPRA
jgi:hypothetical protein